VLRQVGAFAVVLATASVPCRAQQQDDPPFDLGLTERAGVSLVFLDVDVRNPAGEPLRGLTLEDFEVTLNGRRRQLYSVDDLCRCAPGGGVPAEQFAAIETPGTVERPRYILYFDLAQLLPLARERALAEARRWVRDVKAPEDEATITAYATTAGLRTLAPFTADRRLLEQALDSVETDRELRDSWPLELANRREDCGPPVDPARQSVPPGQTSGIVSSTPLRFRNDLCALVHRDDYFHARRSFRALLALLTRMAEVAGRKHLLLFFEELVLDPAGEYGGGRSTGTPGFSSLLDEVAGAATAARTSIHAAFSGEIRPPSLHPADFEDEDHTTFAVNFGANIADWTGGSYNRGPGTLAALLEAAGRSCECIYRIAIEPTPQDAGRVYQARIVAAGMPLGHPYRVQFLREQDRWLRKAESVLVDPHAESEVSVQATIVPLNRRDGRWDVMVEVALDPDSLVMIPEGERQKGEWEVGALFAGSHTGQAWEMLGVSRLSREPEQVDEGARIVHRRRFDGLKARGYELRAFVHDRWAGAYGGGMETVMLPATDEVGIVGPVALVAAAAHVVADLPLWTEKSGAAQLTKTGRHEQQRIAVAGRVLPGQPIEFLTWLCGMAEENIGMVERRVRRGDEIVVETQAGRVRQIDDCFRLDDRLPGGEWPAGDYRYEVVWRPAGVSEAITGSAPFTVGEPSATPR
jgi:VWFA-related protein